MSACLSALFPSNSESDASASTCQFDLVLVFSNVEFVCAMRSQGLLFYYFHLLRKEAVWLSVAGLRTTRRATNANNALCYRALLTTARTDLKKVSYHFYGTYKPWMYAEDEVESKIIAEFEQILN